MIGIVLIIIFYDGVLSILWCQRYQKSAEIREGLHILDLVCVLASESQSGDAGPDIVLREYIGLTSGCCPPDTLRTDLVLSRFHTDQKIVIRRSLIDKFILGKQFIHSL